MATGKKGISAFGAAIFGVVMGAAAAVLADKKNRKVIGKTVSEAVDEGEKKIDQARKYLDSVGTKASSKKAVKPKAGKRKRKRSTK